MLKLPCHVCSSESVTEFASFPELGRATSDCKPWAKGGRLVICNDCCIVQKVIDPVWRAEVKQIYDVYTLYELADGKEQPMFNSSTGQNISRSGSILSFLQSNFKVKDNSKIIDIGCGVGNTLNRLHETFSQASLYGLEPNPHQKQALCAIPNVVDIYVDMQEIAQQKFDVITLVHVLEHVDAPIQFLKSLGAIMQADGVLAIGVPNYVTNPFDLIITDHCSHFSPDTLGNLLQIAGFEIIGLSDTVINKELVAICKLADPSTNTITPYPPINNTDLVRRQLYWLGEVFNRAKNAVDHCRPFGVFGTAVAANWLYGQIGEKIDFFIDEDLDRINKLHHQKPIYHSSSIPNNSHVYICLQPNVVNKINARIKSDNFSILAMPEFV